MNRLTRQIAELTSLLSLEKGKGKNARGRAGRAAGDAEQSARRQPAPDGPCGPWRAESGSRVVASSRVSPRSSTDQKDIASDALAKVDLLNQQLLAVRRQIAALNEALQAAESKDKDSQARISDLGARLNVVLARQVQELQRYRSDFFGRLRELLRDRKDIRIVGDRFVFQSEVLFPSGQALMTAEGLAAIDQLAAAIVELERQIPDGDRLGAAGRRPHRPAPDRQPRVSRPTGSCRARAPPPSSNI